MGKHDLLAIYLPLYRCQKNISCLDKAVDSHDGHIRLALGVVHQVEVNQLLQLQVVCLHAVHYIWEQRTEKQNDLVRSQCEASKLPFTSRATQSSKVLLETNAMCPNICNFTKLNYFKLFIYVVGNSQFKLYTVPDILANSHGCDDLFHRLFSLLLLLIVQLCL